MKTLSFAGCALLLVLAGCGSDSTTTTKKAAEKPPEPVTGLSALYKMYQVARSWAPDTEILKLSNINATDVKPAPGKWGAWQATFTSASKGRARSYTYSVVESGETLHKGVFAGQEEAWSGPKGVSKPLPIAGAKIDSDAAYETALKEKGAEYEKKNPGKPVTYLLEWNKKFDDPSWRVIWGESVGTSNFSVFVDASNGKYLETMR